VKGNQAPKNSRWGRGGGEVSKAKNPLGDGSYRSKKKWNGRRWGGWHSLLTHTIRGIKLDLHLTSAEDWTGNDRQIFTKKGQTAVEAETVFRLREGLLREDV